MPRWTSEAREKQRQKIHEWSPWQSSTGPKTPAGKAWSSQNARIPELEKHERELLELAQAIGGGEVRQTASTVVFKYKSSFPVTKARF